MQTSRHQYTSVHFSTHQNTSVHIGTHQLNIVHNSIHQKTSVHICTQQYTSIHFSAATYACIPQHMCTNSQMSSRTCGCVSTHVCVYRHVPANTIDPKLIERAASQIPFWFMEALGTCHLRRAFTTGARERSGCVVVVRACGAGFRTCTLAAIPRRLHRIFSDLRRLAAQGMLRIGFKDNPGRPHGAASLFGCVTCI